MAGNWPPPPAARQTSRLTELYNGFGPSVVYIENLQEMKAMEHQQGMSRRRRMIMVFRFKLAFVFAWLGPRPPAGSGYHAQPGGTERVDRPGRSAGDCGQGRQRAELDPEIEKRHQNQSHWFRRTRNADAGNLRAVYRRIDKRTCKGQDKIDNITIFTPTPGMAERTLGVERASEHPQGRKTTPMRRDRQGHRASRRPGTPMPPAAEAGPRAAGRPRTSPDEATDGGKRRKATRPGGQRAGQVCA